MSIPDKIQLQKRSNQLVLQYGERTCILSAEFLRVHSPSAEVQGHGPGQKKLQTGKQNVLLTGAEPQGNYALRFFFSDGHSTGIYSWNYLQHLTENQERLWQEYLAELNRAGVSRDPAEQAVQILNPVRPK